MRVALVGRSGIGGWPAVVVMTGVLLVAGCGDDGAPSSPVDAGGTGGAAGGGGTGTVDAAGGAGGARLDAAADVAVTTDGPSPVDAPTADVGAVALDKLVVSGRIVSAAAAVASAEVVASIDRDRNGKIEAGDQTVSAMSGADGQYSLQIPVKQGETVVVHIAKAGLAPIIRVLNAATGAQVTLDAAMAVMGALTCAGTKCTRDDKSIEIEGLSAGMQVSGVALNPVVDTDKFPGSFQDSAGAVLKSGGFAAIEIKDTAGKVLSALAAPAILRMRVPRDTWSIVSDTKPGTDRIEVPLYSFDEVRGTWVADGEGFLEDATGVMIAEATLAAIRARSFGGSVMARASISHASYWNVDWPLTTHACVTGIVVDGNDMPLPGAAVFAGGVDYIATFRPQTTTATGSFCFDVLRGEGATEDVDGNGKNGDKHLVSLHVQYGPSVYLAGAFDPGVAAATCGGACTNLGRIPLTSAREVKTAIEGHWSGDWGEMLLRKVGEEIWGAYTHDQGTVVLRPSPDGVYRGWWSEVPSRMPTGDAGEVEFRFAWNGTELILDGQWRYGVDGAFSPDWDLKHVTTPVPAELEMRFMDATAFRRHP